MKITDSTVAMQSNRAYTCVSKTEHVEADTSKDVAATLTISTDSKETYAAQLKNQLNERNSSRMNLSKEQDERNMESLLKRMNESKENQFLPKDFDDEGTIKMLKKILAILRGLKEGDGKLIKMSKEDLKLQTSNFREAFNLAGLGSTNDTVTVLDISTQGPGAPLSSNVWTKTTAISTSFVEAEAVSFTGTGFAHTEDGREISFNVSMGMSRSFLSLNETFEQVDYIKCDPLVINVGNDVANISDKKFFFDLDGDGTKEKISYATGESGFLALDKNGDGKINDGNELFGTKSGDGFRDLAAYDEDGNGWIDENDSVFKDLKVWTINDDGSEKLVSLKDADVGAIYLGNASTQFSVNDETNSMNAIIQKTGIFLKESGGAGTIQHVDLIL